MAAGVSIVAVGGAILLGGSLPALVGWFAVYLPTTVMGIALLLSAG